MTKTTQALADFMDKAVQQKSITDTEIIDLTAGIPDADFDDIYNALTEAGVQIVEQRDDPQEEPLMEADTPEDDWDGGSMDSLHMYLHEIGQYPLLTQDEEQELSETMVAGRKAEEILNSKRKLSEQRIIELKAQVKAGEKAKQKLIECNLRFVVYLARPYQSRDMHLLDLIQSGNIGLMRGVERYEPNRGYRLTTYAGWWIRQAITRDIANTSRSIRLPVHISEKARKVKAIEAKLMADGITDFSDFELAEAAGMTVNELRSLRRVTQDAVSLNTPVGDDDGDTMLIDMLADDSEGPEDAVEQSALHDALVAVMDRVLSDKERQVINLRMGLNGGPCMTLEQVGKELHVTRERIRQIEAKALRKLKNTRNRKAYLDYVDPAVLEEEAL